MPAQRVTSNSPWHIILVLDDSGSMSGQPAQDVNAAVTAMIEEFNILSMGSKPYFRISIVSFGSSAQVLCEYQSEQQVNVSQVAAFAGNSGSTDAAAALEATYNLLMRNPGNPTDFVPYVFFMSDGAPDDEGGALAASAKLKSMSIPAGTPRVVTIGLGSSVNDNFMRQLATNTELYKHLQNSKEITKFFPAIGTLTGTKTGTDAVDTAIVNL
jgi:uncharacterized protein YegL